MKKYFCILACIALVLPINAQVLNGSFKALQGQQRANFEVDFSEASIHGMTEEDFADYETDWYKDKREVVAIILNECNEKCRRAVTLGRFDKSPYLVKLVVRSISSKGDFDFDAYLFDTEGNQLGSIENLWGKGGRFGTKLNLIKDGAESSGKALGGALRTAILKGKVQREELF